MSKDEEPTGPVAAVRHLGEFIREQRRSSQISVRQLAKTAGVSNPYLSQIERGLRKPSAEILQQLAKALRISAEALYIQAGILEQREAGGVVTATLQADEGLTERQKQVLLEIYDSFRKENLALARLVTQVAAEPPAAPEPAPRKAAPRKKAAAPKAAPRKTATPKTATPKTAPRKTTPKNPTAPGGTA